jgi:hypothetical protein
MPTKIRTIGQKKLLTERTKFFRLSANKKSATGKIDVFWQEFAD